MVRGRVARWARELVEELDFSGLLRVQEQSATGPAGDKRTFANDVVWRVPFRQHRPGRCGIRVAASGPDDRSPRYGGPSHGASDSQLRRQPPHGAVARQAVRCPGPAGTRPPDRDLRGRPNALDRGKPRDRPGDANGCRARRRRSGSWRQSHRRGSSSRLINRWRITTTSPGLAMTLRKQGLGLGPALDRRP